MALTRGALLLGLACLWGVEVGWAQPGSTALPAGDLGLCLALAWWRVEGSPRVALGLWLSHLVLASWCLGTPAWLGWVLGWPSWYLARRWGGALGTPGFVGLAATLATLFRCGGKLLCLSLPGSAPLTLSGPSLMSSLAAELGPHLLFLSLFLTFLTWSKSR